MRYESRACRERGASRAQLPRAPGRPLQLPLTLRAYPKKGQVQFAGTARRVLRTNWTCRLFRFLNFGLKLMLMQAVAYFVQWTVVGTVIGLLYKSSV